MKQLIVLLGMLLIFSGCSMDYKAEVESNTSWSGAFGNGTVDGSGNQVVDLPDDSPQCVVVQKETEGGYLKVRVIKKGGGIFIPDDESDWGTTTAAYGVVDACLK